ncbi:hypothetical protein [Lacinutrix sp. Hel_I_90]|uniref:hypothetical protein n=1 Tax=Lacinutrix sp. Hel_I_90 TaxID=1249999 RepID=UPI0005CA18E6|nr:hypothetical protein [Lacinutrix sp. Hel_I_90]
MKGYKKIIILSFLAIFALSCSDEGVQNPHNTNETAADGNYFPSTENDFWNYSVSNTDNTTSENITSNDSLYVVSETANTFMLDVNEGMPANGTMTSFLSSGSLTRTNTALLFNGTLELPEEIASLFNFDITLNDFILFDASAGTNTELSANTNTISQDFNGLPVTITYILSTKALGNSENIMLNNTVYNRVTASQLTLNISVSTIVSFGGFPITITILDPQDILVSTNYFADTIGLVQATSQSNYQISDTAIAALEAAGQTLAIPASGSSTNIQNLTTFSVTE